MLQRLKIAAKCQLAPILYRYPPTCLMPSELGIYIYTLLERAGVPGDVAEVGCSVGGTACLAAAALKKHAPHKSYTCFDTFSGFVDNQFDAEVKRGAPVQARNTFTSNSKQLVRRILDIHDVKHVELVAGDIAKVPDASLAPCYSVVLCDVDLYDPTYIALNRFYPRLSPGGIILVDDCNNDDGQRWHAKSAYEKFCAEQHIHPRNIYGFGVVERRATDTH